MAAARAEGVGDGAGGGGQRRRGRRALVMARAERVGSGAGRGRRRRRLRRLPRDDDDNHWPRRCPSPRPLPSQIWRRGGVRVGGGCVGLLPQPTPPRSGRRGEEAVAAAATPCNGGVHRRRCLLLSLHIVHCC
ncbi:Os05g0192700 [Oryza sativa Japonica Group]|uniref:Os05g0192700 protein n=2 Tax=Oryza sativa subsp. japonica TaxID=39947 RepID=C7J2P1_ORYSJ|nr:Os05g0192700 [Oryza sativa Japonica Group]BAS92651.1 Os05g0192700 [Oryza sativa Japonica Group]|eukprot:NP_001174258.1 Os05g0192700 [Oryza sativa Japonica Group]